MLPSPVRTGPGPIWVGPDWSVPKNRDGLRRFGPMLQSANQLKSMVSKGAFESVGIDSIQLGLRLLETLKLVSSPAQGR